MSDYGESIITYEYKYKKPIYYDNRGNSEKSDCILKLLLDENNFNFDLANLDGTDFRLMNYDGINILKLWKAYWSNNDNKAVLFFKIPIIPANKYITFYAYWGNTSAIIDVSDPSAMNFLFYETFDSSPLSSSIWSGDISNTVSTYGYSLGLDDYIQTINNVFSSTNSWVLEAGIRTTFTSFSYSNVRSVGFNFYGTENNFYVSVMCDSTISCQDSTGTFSDTTSNIGLYYNSYQTINISYYEPEDKIYYYIKDRIAVGDAQTYFSRRVEGDTRPNYIRVLGYASGGAYPVYINWLILRNYDTEFIELDGSNLFIPYETINHQNQDFREFSDDITSIEYNHVSSFGGNPYSLSDGSDLYFFESSALAAAEAYINIDINTGWGDVNLVDRTFIHYDSGHEEFYNASKLSDDDLDNRERTSWRCTSTSGWATIKFSRLYPKVNTFLLSGPENLQKCPKDFSFYGSNLNPNYYFNEAILLNSGTLNETDSFQFNSFNNDSKFKYYILDIKNTYGDENIEIQEWKMFTGNSNKYYLSQLRLLPNTDYFYNFPKEISLQGSNDSINWTTILDWTYTYSPFIQHYIEYGYWQRYSFDHGDNGYLSFRLLCRGNWGASNGKIIISEWSLHELLEENYTYRILEGTSNNIQQISALSDCSLTGKSSIFYVTNDYLNKVSYYKVVGSSVLPEYYEDINISS